MGENTDGRFRITEDILDREAEGNHAGFPVFPRPKVKMSVGVRLDLADALESELIIDMPAAVHARKHAHAGADPHQKIVQIGLAQQAHYFIEFPALAPFGL